jgi:integrase
MNATLMDGLNTPLKTRQSHLGHADPTTTIENYTHVVDADSKAVAEQICALLSPKKEDESVQ